ncbi:MAG TPA: heme-copper oxidase subunit III [Candidatus Acidoferrales bacterium]|nr:heme-copper oxidase subunit III [Candidatus Acidoferrales bacterium]
MAVAAQPHETQPQLPVLSIQMMGMYIFLSSEVMFFAALFGMYFYFVGSHPIGWPPRGTLPVQFWPLPTINTVILLSSGVTCHFGLESLRHGRLGRSGTFGAVILVVGVILMVGFGFAAMSSEPFDGILGLAAAAVALVAVLPMLGIGPFQRRASFYGLWVATILLGAMFEAGQAWEFSHAQIKFQGLNQFGSAFFTLTGFHGLHVAGGLLLLTLMLVRSLRGQFNERHNVGPAAVTLYWHFVDVVWLALYTILYLTVTA